MPSRPSHSRRRQSISALILSLALACTASPFEPDEIGSSPQIQDLFLNPPTRECPILQDGSTTNSFPWTHSPTCSQIILPPSESHVDNGQTFCVYTNSAFHAGRGISIITTPEVAAELSSETWDHSTGAPSQSTNSSLWEAKPTPGKGIGLFAKKLFSPGETLIHLNPLLIVHPSVLHSPSPSRLVLLEKAVSQLPPSSQSLITTLSRRGGASPLEDIINVNAIRAKIWNLTSYLLIVPEIARINHACRPTTFYRFTPSTLHLTLFPLTPITPSSELSLSYIPPLTPFSTRQSLLDSTWAFTCTCPLCSSPPTIRTTSDTRIADILAIKNSLPTSLEDIPQYIALLPKLIRLLEEEGVLSEIPVYQEMLAYVWSAVGDEGRARAWGERAEVEWGVVAGRESVEVGRVRGLLGGVREHWTWGRWEGDIWEGVGRGHPWDGDGDGDHDHRDDEGHH